MKKCKNLLAKLDKPDTKSDEFHEAILELRNTPNANGFSPNELVFGRILRSRLPAHHSSFDPKWTTISDIADSRQAELNEKAHAYYNASARDLKPLRVGTPVRIQDPISKRWDRVGDIVGVGQNRDYRVKLPSGRTWWRNRRFLRRYNAEAEDDDPTSPAPAESKDDEHPSPEQSDASKEPVEIPRKSTREKKTIVRYGINTIYSYVP